MQYSRTDISANLDGTMQVTQEAFASTPADHDKGQTLRTVEDYLADIFSRTVAWADLQDAISLIQEALACSPTQSFAPANTIVQSLFLYSQEIFNDQEHRWSRRSCTTCARGSRNYARRRPKAGSIATNSEACLWRAEPRNAINDCSSEEYAKTIQIQGINLHPQSHTSRTHLVLDGDIYKSRISKLKKKHVRESFTDLDNFVQTTRQGSL